MKEVVFWTVYALLMVLGFATFAFCSLLVVEFFQLRKEKAVSIRMPHLTVFQLVITAMAILFDVISIPLYYTGYEHSYTLFLFIRVVYLIVIVTSKITRIWCFNWRYALTRHEMETLWKTQMQLKESKSWAVHSSAIFSDWKRALICGFLVTALLIFTGTVVAFALTQTRVAVSIGIMLAFVLLYVPAFWALYRTKDSRDVYGVRNQLMLEVYLVAGLMLAAALLTLAPKMSMLHRFLSFAVVIVFTAVYFFATTRLQLWKIKRLIDSKPMSISGHMIRLGTLSATDEMSANETLTFKHTLANYAGFELFAEHCHREMTLSSLFFVVAYMRLKEYVFRFLKAEDLFEFEAGVDHSNDSAILQQVFRKVSAPSKLPVSALLAGRSPERSQLSASITPESISATLQPLTLAASHMESNSLKVVKQKFSHELGRIVELPLKVLRLKFTEFSLDGCVQRVSELLDKYVSGKDSKEYCVSISSSARENALDSHCSLAVSHSSTERLQCVWECIDACDEVLVEVMQTLKDNSFSRFAKTPESQQWLHFEK